jgi:carbonic anhydrase
MAATLATIPCNPHIMALETALAAATRPVEWLVIAHNDPRMLSTLRSALAGESAAVLEVSQELWDFDGRQIPETIEWALTQTPIRHLVLAGHTLAGSPTSRASLSAIAPRNGGQESYSKLLTGAQRNNARNHAAQERMAMQFQQLCQIPLVDARCSSGELHLYALLYRSDSGLFLAYDSHQEQFHPLVASHP